MINSFIDLVNESNDGLVDEMGVKRPERLQQSHIGRTRAETLARTADLANRPPRRTYAEVAAELVRALKQINRTDITMERPANSRRYYPKFPAPIVQLMNELKNIDEDRFKSEFGRWRDVYPTYDEAVYFKTEAPSDFQRSHFPNGGIPSSLRGTGLGYKLYRTLLKYAGYISSNPSGTTEKDRAWGSMLSYKSNPDGTPSEDDAYAVIGPGNWLAIDKSMPVTDAATLAQNFINNVIGLRNTSPDRFDIDDDLLEVMPNEFLTQLPQTYIEQLLVDQRIDDDRADSIMAARTEVQRQEEERRARQEAEARERRAREEAETRTRIADRLIRFGADPDADWNVGDFIVVKSYLYDQHYNSLPIRRVVGKQRGSYYATRVADAIRIDNGDLEMTDANDTRTTSDKSNWVKVNPEAIPDLTRVNLTTEEQKYISSLMNPEVARQREEETARREAERIDRERVTNKQRSTDQDVYGTLPENGRELKDLVLNRAQLESIDILKKFRTGNFTNFIVLGSSQREALRQPFGIPVFGAYRRVGRSTIQPVNDPQELINNSQNITLINLVTGQKIQGPFVGLGLTAYELGPVSETDKLAARAGDHYYIANHQNNWGILGKCDYTTRNTVNQPFMYIRTFGGAERPTAVRLDLLRKITSAPIEL